VSVWVICAASLGADDGSVDGDGGEGAVDDAAEVTGPGLDVVASGAPLEDVAAHAVSSTARAGARSAGRMGRDPICIVRV
jgi:hypothetical protein